MAYEKQTWVTGEVITKEKLNHMEDGIANSGGSCGVIASSVDENDALDKTWNEVDTALKNGNLVFAYGTSGDLAFCAPVVETSIGENAGGSYYVVVILNRTGQTVIPVELKTNDPNGYPAVSHV